MQPYKREHYALNRQKVLESIINTISNDNRFIAMWLVGSYGQHTEDELSDLDLRIVVADEYADSFCEHSPQPSGTTTHAERLALYTLFGNPLVLREAPSFDPIGGCFNHVIYYETAITIDWVFIPQKLAQIPQHDCLLLFDKINLPTAPLPTPESLEEHIQKASYDVSDFWMMMCVGIKYLLRNDIISWDRFMFGNAYILQSVKQRIAGEPLHYTRLQVPLATTRPEQVALIQHMCSEMLAEMPKLVALGGHVPHDPMSIINVWLSIE